MKKQYVTPDAEKMEFSYTEMVVASNCSYAPYNENDDTTCDVDFSEAMG